MSSTKVLVRNDVKCINNKSQWLSGKYDQTAKKSHSTSGDIF